MKEENSYIAGANLDGLPFLFEKIEHMTADYGPATTNKAKLLLEEALVNIASYAYKGAEQDVVRLELNLSDDPDKLALRFIDRGKPFNPLTMPDPDIEKAGEKEKAGGYGIYLMKQLSDKIEYKREGNENQLEIILHLQQA